MPADKPRSNSFHADAVLFDMDGTLTDSIAAVEAAWGKVADDLNLPRAEVIAATHGRRAIDNLTALKPHIKASDMNAEVEAFERTILAYADAYNNRRTRPKISPASSGASSPQNSECPEDGSPEDTPPSLTPDSSNPSSRRSSESDLRKGRNFVQGLTAIEPPVDRVAIVSEPQVLPETTMEDIPAEMDSQVDEKKLTNDLVIALEADAEAEDRSIRVLPGVHRIINSLPEGRYAVATSGAKTYAHGALTRVGITPPPVTITACDPRLTHGKPHPAPFLLAARELGYAPQKCVVFEDSPAGIRAGVASGATVVAVATSHEKSKIINCGAHFVVDDLESVSVEIEGDKLKFTVTE